MQDIAFLIRFLQKRESCSSHVLETDFDIHNSYRYPMLVTGSCQDSWAE
jgi:hypothetical protein